MAAAGAPRGHDVLKPRDIVAEGGAVGRRDGEDGRGIGRRRCLGLIVRQR